MDGVLRIGVIAPDGLSSHGGRQTIDVDKDDTILRTEALLQILLPRSVDIVGRIQMPLAFALPRPLLQSIQHDADERLFAIRSLKRHKLFSGKLPLRFVRTRRALRNRMLHRSVNPLPILR